VPPLAAPTAPGALADDADAGDAAGGDEVDDEQAESISANAAAAASPPALRGVTSAGISGGAPDVGVATVIKSYYVGLKSGNC
jgi:hypothetical protein